MKNQLTMKAPPLREDEKWVIHNYYTPMGIRQPIAMKFNDFPDATWKQEYNGMHLFELRNSTSVIMAFCRIVKK